MGRTGKHRGTFREGMRSEIERLFDAFIGHEATALRSSRRIEELHEMRLAGKPLRYAMEAALPAFAQEFGERLDDVRSLLAHMGEIHDCDVHLASLRTHLEEVRLFNRSIRDRSRRFRTTGVRALMTAQRQRRIQLFGELQAHTERWRNDNFRERLLSSMNL
jgi:CHAD domain-containing protein